MHRSMHPRTPTNNIHSHTRFVTQKRYTIIIHLPRLVPQPEEPSDPLHSETYFLRRCGPFTRMLAIHKHDNNFYFYYYKHYTINF